MFKWLGKNSSKLSSEPGEQVGYFGKHPAHADFIRHNVHSVAALTLDSWVRDGVAYITRKYGCAWPPEHEHCGGLQFMLPGAAEKATLAGHLVPSQDRSGRLYPFVTFATSSHPLFHTMQAAFPCWFRSFFAQKRQTEQGTALEKWADGMRESIAAEGLPNRRQILQAQIDLLSEIPFAALLSFDARGTEPGWCETFFVSFFKEIDAVLQRTPARTNWGLRLPLPSDRNLLPFVVFWLQMIEAILESPSLTLYAFWSMPGESDAPSLTVFFRPPPASSLASLIDESMHNSQVLDLMEAQPSTPCKGPVELEALMQKIRTSSLLDVLYRIGRRELLSERTRP